MKKTPDKIKGRRKEKLRATEKQREKVRTADAASKRIVKVRRETAAGVVRAIVEKRPDEVQPKPEPDREEILLDRAVERCKEALALGAEQNKPSAAAQAPAQAPTPSPANEEPEEWWFVEGATADTAHLDDLAKTRSLFCMDHSDRGKVWLIKGGMALTVTVLVAIVALAVKDACPTNLSPPPSQSSRPEPQKSPEQKSGFDINCEFNFVPPNVVKKPICRGLKDGAKYSLVWDEAASAGPDGIVRGSILIDENQDGTEDYRCDGVSLLRPKDASKPQKLEQLTETSPLKCLPIAP